MLAALDTFLFYLGCLGLIIAALTPFAVVTVFGIAAWAQHRSNRAS